MAVENHALSRIHAHAVFASSPPDEAVTTRPADGARFHQSTVPVDPRVFQLVRAQIARLFASAHFDASVRSCEFLRYVVDEVLAGRAAYLKQAAIAVEVFGRSPDFDPITDPIVRVQAGRLRRSLERYYLLSDGTDSVRIELPKGSYAPVFVEIASAPAPELAPAPQVSTAMPGPSWPTVVIYPFAVNSSRDEEPAARLKDELAAELGRYGIVHVVRLKDSAPLAPHVAAAARFELHGTARDMTENASFGARLVDRSSAQQIWADEFCTEHRPGHWSGTARDIGQVIAARVGADLGVIARLLAGEHGEHHHATGGPFGAIAAFQHFQFSRHTGALVAAVEALQHMTARSPEIELGWTSLARLYLQNHTLELSSMFTPLEMAIGCAHQSVRLEPASARTRCLMAMTLLAKGELDAARREAQLALRLNGDSLACREIIGWLLALTGDWDAGVALMRAAKERNPFCQAWVSHGLWADHMRRGEFPAAYDAALDFREPTFFWRELMITASLGHLGRPEDAHAAAGELLRIKPQIQARGRRLIGHYIKADELRAVIVEGLHQAGVDLF